MKRILLLPFVCIAFLTSCSMETMEQESVQESVQESMPESVQVSVQESYDENSIETK